MACAPGCPWQFSYPKVCPANNAVSASTYKARQKSQMIACALLCLHLPVPAEGVSTRGQPLADFWIARQRLGLQQARP